MKLHPETLNPRQRSALAKVGPVLSSLGFYLAGGTALGLHLGHRHSVDFDWFTPAEFSDAESLASQLIKQHIVWRTTRTAPSTLIGRAGGVSVSAFQYRYALLRQTVSSSEFQCRLASLTDIAAMKMAAIAQRGAKKDFVDVFALGKTYLPLPEMLKAYRRKYDIEEIGHVLQGLSYFKDADPQPMPRMLWKVNWREIKRTIAGWVKAAAG